MNTQNRERKNNMIHLRFKEKRSLREISEIYHISRERVRQIIGNTGTGIISERQKEIVKNNPTLTNRELSKMMKISPQGVTQYRKGIRHAVERNCSVGIGYKYEEFVSKKFIEMGIENKLMPNHSPFDMLLNNGLKIEIKYRSRPHKDSSGYLRYAVTKSKRKIMPDFYVIVIKEDLYIIPMDFCGSEISIPVEPIYNRSNKWESVKNNFSLLSK